MRERYACMDTIWAFVFVSLLYLDGTSLWDLRGLRVSFRGRTFTLHTLGLGLTAFDTAGQNGLSPARLK